MGSITVPHSGQRGPPWNGFGRDALFCIGAAFHRLRAVAPELETAEEIIRQVYKLKSGGV